MWGLLSRENELPCFLCVGGMDKYFIQSLFCTSCDLCAEIITTVCVTLLSAIVFHGILPLKYYFSVLCSVSPLPSLLSWDLKVSSMFWSVPLLGLVFPSRSIQVNGFQIQIPVNSGKWGCTFYAFLQWSPFWNISQWNLRPVESLKLIKKWERPCWCVFTYCLRPG